MFKIKNTYIYKMVLLSSTNHIIIRKNHLLKCLEKKQEVFKICIEPLTENLATTLRCTDDKNLKFENLSNSDIKIVFNSK